MSWPDAYGHVDGHVSAVHLGQQHPAMRSCLSAESAHELAKSAPRTAVNIFAVSLLPDLEDIRAFLAVDDQTGFSQDGKLLGDVGLGLVEDG